MCNLFSSSCLLFKWKVCFQSIMMRNKNIFSY
uniref:Uncharacterized protein n=1 Tax=Rhizophora mucronata TaxID=61149 RepID=A0A2P2NQL8_RHIMU